MYQWVRENCISGFPLKMVRPKQIWFYWHSCLVTGSWKTKLSFVRAIKCASFRLYIWLNAKLYQVFSGYMISLESQGYLSKIYNLQLLTKAYVQLFHETYFGKTWISTCVDVYLQVETVGKILYVTTQSRFYIAMEFSKITFTKFSEFIWVFHDRHFLWDFGRSVRSRSAFLQSDCVHIKNLLKVDIWA